MTELSNKDAILAELRSKSLVELKAAWLDLEIDRSKIVQAQEIVLQLWKEKEVEEQEKAKAAERALTEVPAEFTQEKQPVKSVSKKKKSA